MAKGLVQLLERLAQLDPFWYVSYWYVSDSTEPIAGTSILPVARAFRNNERMLAVWPCDDPDEQWLQGWEAAGRFIDEMNAAGIQVQLTTFPNHRQSDADRPCVVLYLDFTGERFLPDSERETFYGDTAEEAIVRAYVAVNEGLRFREGLK